MKKTRYKASLLWQFTVIILLILVVWSESYLIISRYEEKMVSENTLQMNEKILNQVDGKIDDFYKNFQNIATTIMYSPTVYDYLKAGSKERILKKSNLDFVFHNAMELEEHIVSIYLYDTKNNQIASLERESNSYSDLMEKAEIQSLSKMKFGNLLQPQRGLTGCYLVQFPVYDLENSNYGVLLGNALFQMRTEGFKELLADAQATSDTQMYLIDGNDRVMASVGAMEIEKIAENMLVQSAEYHVQIQNCTIEGWRIVSRIPVNEVYEKSDSAENILCVTFVITASLMALLIIFCYVRVIHPIRVIDQFMQNLSGTSKCRLKSERTDEIGTVIRSMNQMLDKIDQANKEQQLSQQKIFETELAKKQLQVLAYRNQINPHFLYNTFECIRDMALYYDVEDIAEISMALSKVFRFACKGDNVVTIKQEIEYIREYSKIIDYRFMGKIDVEVDLETGVDEKSVIKLLLQPLVENAVFHGLEQTMDGGEVNVHVGFCGNGHLEILVEDNGCGIPKEQLQHIKDTLNSDKKEKGIGIANIYQRLHLFYGEDVIFDIQSEEGKGTRVRIVIPDNISQQKLKFTALTET